MTDEKELIEKILNGGVDDFKYIIDKYQKKIFSITLKRIPHSDYQEVAQDIYIESFKALEKYNSKYPFENWLVKIAMHKCYDYWRKKSREKEKMLVSFDVHDEWFFALKQSAAVELFEKSISREETIEVINLVLNQLSAEDRLLIDMIYLEGHKLAEVADILGWKISKVKVRSMRAKEKMRKIIKKIILKY
jgi:RNA polymerase sigma-70 factor (ECF subfamily)